MSDLTESEIIKMDANDFLIFNNLKAQLIFATLIKNTNVNEDKIIEFIKKNPNLIKYIKAENQTPKLCLEAVKVNGEAISYIDPINQTYEIAFAAAQQKLDNFENIVDYIKPEYKTVDLFKSLKFKKYIKNFNSEVIKKLIIEDHTLIKYLSECDPINLSNSIEKHNNTKYLINTIFELFKDDGLIKDINKNIINLDMNQFYYSSLNIKLDTINVFEIFKQKNYCWMTDRIDQSLLHLFNDYRGNFNSLDSIQPIIFKFKLKENIRIINSVSCDNFNIFNGILNENIEKFINYIIDESCERKRDPKRPEIDTEHSRYYKDYNVSILLILEQLNKYLQSDQKIYGYKNDNDQKEVGLINFNQLINESSLKKSNIKKITNRAYNFIFPISSHDYQKLPKIYKSLYQDQKNIDPMKDCKFRMTLEDGQSIEYEDFNDNNKSIIHKALSKDEYFKKKYLKYKNKYKNLKLSSFTSLNI